METIPARHIRLLQIANSATAGARGSWWIFDSWKDRFFYPFKSRFLARYAVRAGFDLQCLKLACNRCERGIWYSECGWHSDRCWHCRGTGVFRIDAVKLERWQIGGVIFHCPAERTRGVSRATVADLSADANAVIVGLVKHEPMPGNGLWACVRLLWAYERTKAADLIEEIVQDRVRQWRMRMGFQVDAVLRPVVRWFFEDDGRLAGDLRELLGVEPKEMEEIPF